MVSPILFSPLLKKPHTRVTFGTLGQTNIIPHRGTQVRQRQPGEPYPKDVMYVVYPENTLAAIEDSFRRFNAAEIDVNSNGKILPVFHDDNIAGKNDPGNPFKTVLGQAEWIRDVLTRDIVTAGLDGNTLKDRTLQEKLPDVGSNQVYVETKSYASYIPQLEEVFELLKKYPNAHLFVELKTKTLGISENTKGLEDKVVHLIAKMDLAKQVTIISFNPNCLERVKKLAKKLKLKDLTIGWDIEPNLYLGKENSRGLDLLLFTAKQFGKKSLQNGLGLLIYAAKKLGIHALLPSYKESSHQLVEAARQHEMYVYPWVWPENRQEETLRIKQLKKMGVDGVITNVPDDAQQSWDSVP